MVRITRGMSGTSSATLSVLATIALVVAWTDSVGARPLRPAAAARTPCARSASAASRSPLVPGRPTALLLCRYGSIDSGQRLRRWAYVTDPGQVRLVVAQLNALPPIAPGVYACPNGDGEEIVVVPLSRGRRAAAVHVGLSACRTVSRGGEGRSAAGAAGERLDATLETLLARGHRGS
jgi:hypothetical protein